MNVNNYMQTLIEKIENNLSEEIDIKDFCDLEYISVIEVYRYFYNYTGHSVDEYINNRRLSNALSLVKNSDLTLSEIAETFGYRSDKEFCKCVKKMVGLTPAEYKNSDRYYYFPVVFSENSRRVTVAVETIPETIRIKYYDNKTIDIETHAISYFRSLLPDYKGRVFGTSGKQKDDKFCYDIYIENKDVDINKLLFSDFRGVKVMPPLTGNYANIKVENKEEEIDKAWDYLYKKWLRFSMFEEDEIPYFEEYIYENKKTEKLVLYLPVKERKKNYVINIRSCDEMAFLVAREKGEDAEEVASERVCDYLRGQKIYLMESAKELYVAKKDEVFTCGVRVANNMSVPPESGLEIVKRQSGIYAILDGSWCGAIIVYQAILYAWLKKHSLQWDDSLDFTIYRSAGKAEEDINTRVYVRLKNVK